EALGQIAAREDLSNGPRTVIDVFKLACQEYRGRGSDAGRPRASGVRTPTSAFDLDRLALAFERGEVPADGPSPIRQAIAGALQADLVRGDAVRERAVRLMAMFPTSGLPVGLQERCGLRAAVDDLTRLAGGELVAVRGGGF